MRNKSPYAHEFEPLFSLRTPRKIQDFLETIPINHEKGGESCLSPRRVLLERRAHCIEGAMLAALALRIHGQRPLLLDLVSAEHDLDHVVALYRYNGYWGSISKTNHAVLRFRDPVYRSIRELALSYFHEYFDDHGRKTLRLFSPPIDLSKLDSRNWMTSEQDVWFVAEYINSIPHYEMLSRAQLSLLRKADAIEIKAGNICAWPKRKS